MCLVVFVCGAGGVGEPLHHHGRNQRHMQIIQANQSDTQHSFRPPITPLHSKSTIRRHCQRLKFAFLFNCGNCGFALPHTHKNTLSHTHEKRCLYNFFHNATKHCNIFLWPHIFLLSYSFVLVSPAPLLLLPQQRFSKTFSKFQSRYEFWYRRSGCSLPNFSLWFPFFPRHHHRNEKRNKLSQVRLPRWRNVENEW